MTDTSTKGRPSLTRTHQERVAQEVADGWVSPPVDEASTATAHNMMASGRTLKYHATAGTVTIRDDDAKPTASVFYTAYTLDGASGATRPVTFFWNGGPGSASLWLHMGSFAPTRVQIGDPEAIRPAPYTFGPNPDTKDFEWDWKHKTPGAYGPQNNPDVAPDLAAAMRINPYLSVLSLNRYFNMATSFFATEYDIAHMMLEPKQRQNLSFRYYPSDHMIYLDPSALHQLHSEPVGLLR